MEQNYRLTIAYDGSRFFGWERQPDKDTIQGKLEAVIQRSLRVSVRSTGPRRCQSGTTRSDVASASLALSDDVGTCRDGMDDATSGCDCAVMSVPCTMPSGL